MRRMLVVATVTAALAGAPLAARGADAPATPAPATREAVAAPNVEAGGCMPGGGCCGTCGNAEADARQRRHGAAQDTKTAPGGCSCMKQKPLE